MVGVNLQDVCGDGDDGEKKEGGECEDGSRFGLIDSLSLGTRARFLAQDRIIVLPSCCLLKHRSRVDICRVLR
jgi:hypothetical protein